MKSCKYFLFAALLALTTSLNAQEEDLLSLLGEEESINYVTGSFKATRVINLHSLENMSGGELDIRIHHRFDPINEVFMIYLAWTEPLFVSVPTMALPTG